MSLKSDVICNICKKFLLDPIYLPCCCWICSEHVQSNGDTIECLNCNETFAKSKKFRPNETAQKIIKENMHLTEEQKTAKKFLEKLTFDLDTMLKEFELNQSNFELNIHEHFVEIRRKIDYQREKLKEKIDDIALEMIDITKEREKNLIENLTKEFSKILNRNILDKKQAILDEFRNPNMIVEQINNILKESDINQLNEHMKNFNLQLNQISQFEFIPNESTSNKTFGFLNLNSLSQKLVSCSDVKIKVWDLETFECIQTLYGHDDTILCLEKVKTNQILSGSDDGTIKLWDIYTDHCIKTFNCDSGVNCLRLLSENTFASGCDDAAISIWNIDDSSCIKTLDGHNSMIFDLLLLPNGSLVSCSLDKTIKVWNVDQGDCIKTLNGHTKSVYCLVLLRNGNLASGSEDKTIKIWNLEFQRCILTLTGHGDSIPCLQLGANGELISSSDDGTIKIWNLESRICTKTLEGHASCVNIVKAYKDNLLVSGSYDQTIKIWNLNSGECIRTKDGLEYQVISMILI